MLEESANDSVVGFWTPGLTRRFIEAFMSLVCGVFIITALVYHVEKIRTDQFSVGRMSFFRSFYFTVVTLTTIGYGDLYPARFESRLIVADVRAHDRGLGTC